jgi:thiamine biosynthesis lipoprotein
VEIDDASVVSSGVYERCFTADGKNYHHLLDPRTGYPYDNGLISVVIICPESVDGDALSTTCFSLGLEKGMELLDSTEDAAGIFITEDYELHFSEGAAELSIYDEDGKPLKNLNEVTDYES